MAKPGRGRSRGGSQPGGPQRPPSNTHGAKKGIRGAGKEALRSAKGGKITKGHGDKNEGHINNRRDGPERGIKGGRGRGGGRGGDRGRGNGRAERGGRGGSKVQGRNGKEDRYSGKEEKEKGGRRGKFGRKPRNSKESDAEDEEEEFETVPLEKDEDEDDVWESGSDIGNGDSGEDDWEEYEEGGEGEMTMDMQSDGEADGSEAGDEMEDEAGSGGDAISAEEAVQSDEENSVSSDNEDDDDGEMEETELAAKIKAANRKGKKSGGFQSMGLSYPIYKAIGHKGYKIPTPIQRRSVPIIMEGRDVVAMARTGSGKTAAFIIPLLERLKTHSAKVGARGLILSPSRELALQTLKFVKDLGKYTDLRFCVLVGGDSMDDQFSAMASNPDVIIATPGRLMHLIIEMNLDLKTVEYVVFDEADRLFEMGFAEQLREILFRLPESRQTLLFSATLPKLLVDFAKAGLSDPALIRLDVDTKISKDLQMYFFSVKHEEKEAALLSLFRTAIPKDQMTVVFVATKHHVEYIQELLSSAGIDNTYIYGALDQSARKIHLARFRAGKTKVLIVTDVAARGIDVPLLDNVINYDFPASNKVFVHRVGRAARAGRTGKAFSLVSTDEVPYLLELQLFTSRPLVFATSFEKASAEGTTISREPNYTSELVFGIIPPSTLSVDVEHVLSTLKNNINIENLEQSAKNAYKMYYKSRPVASKELYAKAKEIGDVYLGIHPLLSSTINASEQAQAAMIASISKFRPSETVFETTKKGLKTTEALLMQKRRGQFGGSVAAWRSQKAEKDVKIAQQQSELLGKVAMEDADEEELESSFTVLTNRKRKRPTSFRDTEHYISYTQADADTERGYAVQSGEGPAASFAERAKAATLELTGEDADGLRKPKGALIWDKTKHNFVRPTIGADNKKKIRTESGFMVNASFKSRRFDDWQKRTKVSLPRAGELELTDASQHRSNAGSATGVRKYRHNSMTAPDVNSKSHARKQKRRDKEAKEAGAAGDAGAGSVKGKGRQPVKTELKTVQQIAKERKEKEKRRAKTGRHGMRGKGRGRGRGRH